MEPDILIHNRKSNRLETEHVYGEKWLDFAYNNPLGKAFLWTIVKRPWFSKWYGWRMNARSSAKKIKPFVEKYGLDPSEFRDEISDYHSFNDFFARKLKPTSRPIPKDDKAIIFPADGRHFGYENVTTADKVFVKGQKFNLAKLFGSKKEAKPYAGGTLILSRLCPTDYHRFHFPVKGILRKHRLINGSLLSVNPIALRKNLSIFWENKRYLSYVENPELGKVAVFLIGATCVGTARVTAEPNILHKVGEELGYFSFGGSSLITVFQPKKIQLDEDLLKMTKQGYESYAHMGDIMADPLFN